MPSLPTLGQKPWQQPLEDWLLVAHNADGTNKGSAVPVGTVVDFAGTVAPTGWFLCNGASLLRSAYPLLFAAIGTNYGAVDGTHFTLPDTRGRVTVGVGTRGECDAVGDSDNLALASRRPQHRHTVNESAHGHGISDPTHAHTVYDPTHEHQYAQGSAATGYGPGVIAQVDSSGYMGESGGGVIRYAATGIGIYGNSTGVTVQGNTTGVTVGNAADFIDAPPFITFNKIIRGD